MAQEKAFENKIKMMLKSNGCYFVKFFANRMTKVGVPDILASVNGYFVGIEVKAQNGRPSELQLHNVRKIRESGGFAFIVYPSGYESLKNFIEGLKNETFNRDLPEILK